MNTIFIGGSRHISRLPQQVKERLDNVIGSGHRIIVGDANGADKAVQKHFADAAYDKVTVFYSGDSYRNNLGQWETHRVIPLENAGGFQFYAAKDREMAREADFGLMIWDGKSPGTVLNVLRLIRAGKKAVLINVPDKLTINIKSPAQWNEFLSRCSAELRADLRKRATTDEWGADASPELSLSGPRPSSSSTPEAGGAPAASDEELAAVINAALAAGDPGSVVNALGDIARAHGMTHVAKEAGLARENLYRSLGTGGNPEFATVLKVMAAVGLRLEARKAHGNKAG